jgi:predicted metal-dependent HD superfamily phosphohydrolase
MQDLFSQTWQPLAQTYSDNLAFTHGIFTALQKAYSNKKRYYHNLQHIEALLSAFYTYQSNIADTDTVLFAIYFHDMVYNVLKSDNEAQSAQKAIDFLSKTTFPPLKIAKVAAFINATKTHQNPLNDPDLDFFLDFDLQILGASPENYQLYTHQIRQEYAIYPDFIYNVGRKKALKHFLDAPYIFKTDIFREMYEATAKENCRYRDVA